MSHLFNRPQYYEFRTKFYPQIKKTLESSIQGISSTISADNLHPIEGPQQTIIDQSKFHLVYEDQNIALPKALLELEDFSTLLNMENFEECFEQQQKKQLFKLVPNQDVNNVRQALEGKGLHESHLKNFQRKIKSGYFSILRQKQDQIMDKLSQWRLKQIYEDLYSTVIMNRKIAQQHKSLTSKPKFQPKDEASEVESLQDLQSLFEFSENSQATESEEEILNEDGEKPQEEYVTSLKFKYDFSKLKTQEEMLAMAEEKRDTKQINYIYKTTLPSKPRNAEWVENYRKQELQRYLNPTKPWSYSCEDNRKVTVAPVAKKISVLTGKPRDHPMLKSERPACVTILTLVRDAAARLPGGVGTRADICELLKESQYINESLPEDKVSNIVSGALDRLHYMTDACVKYDSEKKLWIYLHIDRNNEHPGWGDDQDEYTTEKIKKKKKYE